MATTIADDQIATEQEHTLVMGVMGVGTFVLGFLFCVLAVVWFLSYSCGPVPKSIWRGISTLIFVIVALIVVYAPRTNRYENTSLEPEIYDYSIIPRITVSVLMTLFAVIAMIFGVITLAEPKQISTVDHEYTELWQDE